MIARTQRKRQRAVGWVALGAMLAHVALPVAANLDTRGVGPGSITLCTAYGLRTVVAPEQNRPASDVPAPTHEQHCTPCCACGVLAAEFPRAVPTCDAANHTSATPFFAADNFLVAHARPPPGQIMS
jgi:hypothetical protein